MASSTISLPVAGTTSPGADVSAVRAEPFLHIEPNRIYNPLTDRELTSDDPQYVLVGDLVRGAISIEELDAVRRKRLLDNGWLVEDHAELAARYFLKYVSLEAHTVCNQGCYFCPVSIKRRSDHFMEMELYEDIVRQLAEFRSTIVGVSMINYNEPTVDRRFLDQVRLLKKYELPPAVLTNGSGLTPSKVDGLMEAGGIGYLSVNLSTLDRERYARDREGDHLPVVLRNVDYMALRELAPRMEIVVLGRGDDEHQRDFEEIEGRYGHSHFAVLKYEVMNRAGHVDIGQHRTEVIGNLAGCEQTGSRPLQWAHINPFGQIVLCCQDYDEQYVVGDLREESLRDVLAGEKLQQLRRWAYGLDEAPDDFICRNCIYALTRD